MRAKKRRRGRVLVAELNSNLVCMLCSGYFIDATTLTECLHSFCKSCIVEYLKTSKKCPVCHVLVHKTKQQLHLKSDKSLQDLVYKLIPGLYKDEMKRRRDFYAKHPEGAPSKVGEERGDENVERMLYSKDDKFSVALHFCSYGVKDERSARTLTLPEVAASSTKEPVKVCYLECPGGVTVNILKKFVQLKYDLPPCFLVDIFHSDEVLFDEYTLIDVAYIYTWRKKEPLKLNYSVYEIIIKRRKVDIAASTRLLDTRLANQAEDGKMDLKADIQHALKQAGVQAGDSKNGPLQHESQARQRTAGSQAENQPSPAQGHQAEQWTGQSGSGAKGGQKSAAVAGKRRSGQPGYANKQSTESPGVLIYAVSTSTTTTPSTPSLASTPSQPASKSAAVVVLSTEGGCGEQRSAAPRAEVQTPPQLRVVTTASSRKVVKPCRPIRPQPSVSAHTAQSGVPFLTLGPVPPLSIIMNQAPGKKAVKRAGSPKTSILCGATTPSKKKSVTLPTHVSLLPTVTVDGKNVFQGQFVGKRTGSDVKTTAGGGATKILPKPIISGPTVRCVTGTSLLKPQTQTVQVTRSILFPQTSASPQGSNTLLSLPILTTAPGPQPMLSTVDVSKVLTPAQASKSLLVSQAAKSQGAVPGRKTPVPERKQQTPGQKNKAVPSQNSPASVTSVKANTLSAIAKTLSNSTKTKADSASVCSDGTASHHRTGQLSSAPNKSASPGLLSLPAPVSVSPKPVSAGKAAELQFLYRSAGGPAPHSESSTVPVTINGVLPSAAAGASGAACPSPAALAASSSPSPPMASSAASVREEVGVAHKCVSSAAVCPVPPIVSVASPMTKTSCSTLRQKEPVVVSTSASAVRKEAGYKTVAAASTTEACPSCTQSAGKPQSADHTHLSTPTQSLKSETPTTSPSKKNGQESASTQVSNTSCSGVQSSSAGSTAQNGPTAGSISTSTAAVPETGKAEELDSGKPVEGRVKVVGLSSFENTPTKASPVNTISADNDGKALCPAKVSVSEGKSASSVVPPVSTLGTSSHMLVTSARSAGSGVTAASQAAVSNSSLVKVGPLSNRNGMPTVVARPTRVLNAATSVNTLCQKGPAAAASSAAAVSSAPVSTSSQGLPVSSASCQRMTTTTSAITTTNTSTAVVAPGQQMTSTSSAAVGSPASQRLPASCVGANGAPSPTTPGQTLASVADVVVCACPPTSTTARPVVTCGAAVTTASHARPVTCVAVTSTSSVMLPVTTGANPAATASVSPVSASVSARPVTSTTPVTTSSVSKSAATSVAAAAVSTASSKPVLACTPVSKASVVAGVPHASVASNHSRGTEGLKSGGGSSSDVSLPATCTTPQMSVTSVPPVSSSKAVVTVTRTSTATGPCVQVSSPLPHLPPSAHSAVSRPALSVHGEVSKPVSVGVARPSPNPVGGQSSGVSTLPVSSRALITPVSSGSGRAEAKSGVKKSKPCVAASPLVTLQAGRQQTMLGVPTGRLQTLPAHQAARTPGGQHSLLTDSPSFAHQATSTVSQTAPPAHPLVLTAGGRPRAATTPKAQQPSAKSPAGGTTTPTGQSAAGKGPSAAAAISSSPAIVSALRAKGGLSSAAVQPLVLAGVEGLENLAAMNPMVLASLYAQQQQRMFSQFQLQQIMSPPQPPHPPPQPQQQQQQQSMSSKQQQQQHLQQLQMLQQQHIMNMRTMAALAAGYPMQTPALLAANPHVGGVMGAVGSPPLSPTQPLPLADGGKKLQQQQDGVKKSAAQHQHQQQLQQQDGVKKSAAQHQQQQGGSAGKKGPGESSGKKKITDIANTLHRKAVVVAGESGSGQPASSSSTGSSSEAHHHHYHQTQGEAPSAADHRPPLAHCSTATATPSTTTFSTSSASSFSKTDDEQPLNLVVSRSDSGHAKKSGH